MPIRWMMTAAVPLFLLLQACVPAVVGGAAVGAAAAHDRRTFGAIIDDENIELKAAANIGMVAELKKQVHVNVTSMNGIVLLTGEAATTEARDQILAEVRAVNGVRRITNELRIAEPSSFGSRSKDSLITSAVKSRFLVTKDLDPTRVKVVTETSVVYLLGLVTQAEGNLATEHAATIEGVERVVKVFEYID
ncbi:MAG: outer rane lipoprotein [Proteobacteria bacterium]|nr:outer rane lipoprotein [Pseudomonadota bacterium]MBS1246677.1 outer rane lipoprotein [Pseudomonadota bacterium]